MDITFQENGETVLLCHERSSQTRENFLTKNGNGFEADIKSHSDGGYTTTNIGEPVIASNGNEKCSNEDNSKISGCSDSSFQNFHQTTVVSRCADMFVTNKQNDTNMHIVPAGISQHSLTKCPCCQMIIPYSLVELHSQTCNGNIANHTLNFLQGNLKKCQFCRSIFPNSSIEEHSQVCSRRKVHQCAECKKVFRIRSKLLVHKQSHSAERLHPCKICGKPFKFKSGLSRHVKQQHSHAETSKIKNSLCAELQELGYNSIQDDIKHCKRRESREEENNLWEQHFHEENLGITTKCVKYNSLKAVVNNQKSGDPYEMALNEGNNIVREVSDREQTNLKTLREEGCATLSHKEVNFQRNDEFRKSVKESEHCEQKTADENFKEDGFKVEEEKSNRSNCADREVTINESKSEVNPSEISDGHCSVVVTQGCSETKVFKCPECPKLFEKPSSLIIHRRTHSDLKLFTCEICQQLFKYKGSLKRHVKEQHYGLGRKSFSMVMDERQNIDFDDISSVVSSRLGNGDMCLVNASGSSGKVFKRWKEPHCDGGGLKMAGNKQESKLKNCLSLTTADLSESSGDKSEASRYWKEGSVGNTPQHYSSLEKVEFENDKRQNESCDSKVINHGEETLNEKGNNLSVVHERRDEEKISTASNEFCPENTGDNRGRNFEVLEPFKRKESTMFVERHGEGKSSSDDKTRFENVGSINEQSAKGSETTKSRENMFKVDELQKEYNYPSMIFGKRQEDSKSLYSQNQISSKNDDENSSKTYRKESYPHSFEEDNLEQEEISASMVFDQRHEDKKSLSFQDEVHHSTGKQITETCKYGESPVKALKNSKPAESNIENDEGNLVEGCFEFHHADHFGEEENIFEVNSRTCEVSGQCFSDAVVPVERTKLGEGSAFQCEECEKVFSKQSSLASHKLTHTMDMPFTCEICCKCFKYKGSLARHVKEQHYGMGRKMNDDRSLHERDNTNQEVQKFGPIVKAFDNSDSESEENFDQNMIFDDRQVGSSKKENYLDSSRSILNKNENSFIEKTSHSSKVFDEKQLNGHCYSKEGHGLQKGIDNLQQILNENDHGKNSFYPRLVFAERPENNKSHSLREKVRNFEWSSNKIDNNDEPFEGSSFHPSMAFDGRLEKKNCYSSIEKISNGESIVSIVNENNSNGGNVTGENIEKSNSNVKKTSLGNKEKGIEGNCQTIVLKKKKMNIEENNASNKGESSFEDSIHETRPDRKTLVAVPNIVDTWDCEGSPSDIACKICGRCFKYKGSLARHIKEQHYGLGRKSLRALLQESQCDEGGSSRTEDTFPNGVGNCGTIKFTERDSKDTSVPDMKVVKGQGGKSSAFSQEKLYLQNRAGSSADTVKEVHYNDGSLRDEMIEMQQSYENKESDKKEQGMDDLNKLKNRSEEIRDKGDEKERNLDTTCDSSDCEQPIQVLQDVPQEKRKLNCEQDNSDIRVEFPEVSSLTFKCKICGKHFKYKFSLSRHILEHHYGLGRRCFRSSFATSLRDSSSCSSQTKAELQNRLGSCEASLNEKTPKEKFDSAFDQRQGCENRKRSSRGKTLRNRDDFEQVVKDVDSGSSEEKNFEIKEACENEHKTNVDHNEAGLAHNLQEQRGLNSKKNFDFVVSDDNLKEASEENIIGQNTVKCKEAKLFKCDECPKIFPSRSVLKKHKRIHSDAMAFSCEICQQPFKYKGSVNRHVREQHYGLGRKGFRRFDEEPGNNMVCSSFRKVVTLKEIFQSKDVEQAQSHETTVKRLNGSTQIFDTARRTVAAISKERICSIQENTNFDKNGESTFESVSRKMKQECETLHSSLETVGNKFENEQKSFEVDAKNSGTKKDTSKVHQQKVSKRRKVHRCVNCPKMFCTISDLREHTYKHTDVRSFACKLCGKAFKFRSGLVRHNRKEHKKSGWSQNILGDGKSCAIADEACGQNIGNFESSSPGKKNRPNKNVRNKLGEGKEGLKEWSSIAENCSNFDNEESVLRGIKDGGANELKKRKISEADDGLAASRDEEARNEKRRFDLVKVYPSLNEVDSFCNTANESTSAENVVQNSPFKKKPCLYNCNKCDAVFKQLCDFLTHQRIHKRTN